MWTASSVSRRQIVNWSLRPSSVVVWNAFEHIIFVMWMQKLLDASRTATKNRLISCFLALSWNTSSLRDWLEIVLNGSVLHDNDVWNPITNGLWRLFKNARCKRLCVSAVHLWLDYSRWLLMPGVNRAFDAKCPGEVFPLHPEPLAVELLEKLLMASRWAWANTPNSFRSLVVDTLLVDLF